MCKTFCLITNLKIMSISENRLCNKCIKTLDSPPPHLQSQCLYSGQLTASKLTHWLKNLSAGLPHLEWEELVLPANQLALLWLLLRAWLQSWLNSTKSFQLVTKSHFCHQAHCYSEALWMTYKSHTKLYCEINYVCSVTIQIK